MPFVTSNGAAIPFDADHFAPLRDSSNVRSDPQQLRRRYREDGYVYLRGVLDARRLRQLRRSYFSHFTDGYLAPGSDPADGVFSGVRPADMLPHGTLGHPAHSFVRSQEFLDFCADDDLATVASDILGAPVEQLPRRILRHFDRSRPMASRAHVDYSYLDDGTDRLLTAWIPIGDCPPATGGLVYLEDSKDLGAEALDPLRARTDRHADRRPISHDLAWVAERLGRRWLYADYRAGDVVVHSPHIVHASLDTTTDAMRLIADLRYIAAGDRPDSRWLEAWAGDDGR
jgi:Phytanoyl-CoA dioxygenase (PhyH)